MSIFETAKDGYLPKGLTHGFGKKIQYFFKFFFKQNRPRNNVKLWSRKEGRLSGR